jgi:hypothetical protein
MLFAPPPGYYPTSMNRQSAGAFLLPGKQTLPPLTGFSPTWSSSYVVPSGNAPIGGDSLSPANRSGIVRALSSPKVKI